MRLVCDVLQDMRDLLKEMKELIAESTTKRGLKSRLVKWGKLIEEAQGMVDRMENRLGEYHDFCIEASRQIKEISDEMEDLLEKKGKYKRSKR